MIDTDKYEGHIASEGRTWVWSKWMLKNAETRRLKEHKATRHLLNDAPLLLEEVKRLRETIKAYLDLDMESLEFCRIMRDMGVIE